MPLSHYGSATWDVPLRFGVGDIILCSSRNILTTTVHLSTRSQVNFLLFIYNDYYYYYYYFIIIYFK